MVRYILENQLKKAEELKGFNQGGYQFNPTLSTDQTWIFTR